MGEIQGVEGLFYGGGSVAESELCGAVGYKFDGECVVFLVDWESW